MLPHLSIRFPVDYYFVVFMAVARLAAALLPVLMLLLFASTTTLWLLPSNRSLNRNTSITNSLSASLAPVARRIKTYLSTPMHTHTPRALL